MICFRDRTYCSASFFCGTEPSQCYRKLTDEDSKLAEEMGLPISIANFNETCEMFIKLEDYPDEL